MQNEDPVLQEATKGSQQSGQDQVDVATVCRVGHLQVQVGGSHWLQIGAVGARPGGRALALRLPGLGCVLEGSTGCQAVGCPRGQAGAPEVSAHDLATPLWGRSVAPIRFLRRLRSLRGVGVVERAPDTQSRNQQN